MLENRWTTSEIFRGTRGPTRAKYMVVGESWGQEEQRQLQPFVGQSGKELSRILAQCGISEHEVLFTNVVNARPPQNDMKQFFIPTTEAKKKRAPQHRGLYPREIVWDGLTRLHKQIDYCQPSLIIAFGNYSLWALTHNSFGITNSKGYKVPTGIGNWHGSQIYSTHGIAMLPTYHPAAAMRNWPWMYQIRWDLTKRVPKLLPSGCWNHPDFYFEVRPSFEQVTNRLKWFLGHLNRGPFKLAHDIETRHYHIACSGWAWSKTEAICIPFMTQDDDHGYWMPHEEHEIAVLERRILEHPNLILVGQHYTYDVQYMHRYRHCVPKISHDTEIGHHVCYPGTPGNLVHIRNMYCDYHRYWKDDGKTWQPGVDEEQLWSYNCEDACVTYEASDVIVNEAIPHHGLEEQYMESMDQLQVIVSMMLRGMRADFAAQADIAHDLRIVTEHYAHNLEHMMPEEIWPRKPKVAPWYSSPAQTRDVLYTELNLAKQYNREGGLTTDDQALEKLADRYPACEKLLRTLQQFRSLSTFWQFATMTMDSDGRIRSSFSPTTETFRWRSSESAFGSGRNLQNLPKGQEE